MDEDRCPRCRMSMDEAEEPTTPAGQTYCCPGCANDISCTCPAMTRA